MSAHNVLALVPLGVDVEAAVAELMKPHQYHPDRWDWYAVGGYDWPEIAAYVDQDGWHDGKPPDLPAGMQAVTLRCKFGQVFFA